MLQWRLLVGWLCWLESDHLCPLYKWLRVPSRQPAIMTTTSASALALNSRDNVGSVLLIFIFISSVHDAFILIFISYIYHQLHFSHEALRNWFEIDIFLYSPFIPRKLFILDIREKKLSILYFTLLGKEQVIFYLCFFSWKFPPKNWSIFLVSDAPRIMFVSSKALITGRGQRELQRSF